MSSRLGPHTIDAAALADELVRFRVADPTRLTDLLAEFPGGGAAALAEYLVARHVLTPFQADRALAGEARLIALGPYRVCAPGGGGTFGPVFAAHRGGAEAYRVRVFPLRSLWRARQAGQLARTLSTPPHPAVVPLVDAGSANGFHYLAWPFVGGASLLDRVAATGPLPPREAAAVLAQLADALDACHARGTPHGALTPACVQITPDGQPRLLDLGAGAILAANLADDESMLDTLSAAVAAGCVLEYAAPEFDADPIPSAAADQYALGAVGYFALCGRPPFDGKTLADRLAAKLAGPPAPVDRLNPAVPAALAAVLDRMLRPSAVDRFADLAEVRDVLAPATGPVGTPSTDSIDFELPEPPADPPPPAAPAEPADTPSLALADTVWPGAPDPPEIDPPSPAPLDSPSRHLRPPPESPAPDVPIMANFPRAGGPDPRQGVETPFHYHTEADAPAAPARPPTPDADDRPPEESVLWKRVRRNVLFWQAATDVVQVSVFGPPAVTPGEAAKVSVYLHPPDATRSVRTLSRAFHHDAELIGTGYVTREVARQAQLAVHLSAANAGVSKSLVTFVWRGQPHRLVFDLHVPWEAPGGLAPGLVSVGQDDVRIGKVEFRLNVLPRRG